jgi:hypothetical protein
MKFVKVVTLVENANILVCKDRKSASEGHKSASGVHDSPGSERICRGRESDLEAVIVRLK